MLLFFVTNFNLIFKSAQLILIPLTKSTLIYYTETQTTSQNNMRAESKQHLILTITTIQFPGQ